MRDGQRVVQPSRCPHLHHCLDGRSNFETISGHRVDLASRAKQRIRSCLGRDIPVPGFD